MREVNELLLHGGIKQHLVGDQLQVVRVATVDDDDTVRMPSLMEPAQGVDDIVSLAFGGADHFPRSEATHRVREPVEFSVGTWPVDAVGRALFRAVGFVGRVEVTAPVAVLAVQRQDDIHGVAGLEVLRALDDEVVHDGEDHVRQQVP